MPLLEASDRLCGKRLHALTPAAGGIYAALRPLAAGAGRKGEGVDDEQRHD